MINLKKATLILILSVYLITMSYHLYKMLASWLNQPSQTEIKEQYRKVGY